MGRIGRLKNWPTLFFLSPFILAYTNWGISTRYHLTCMSAAALERQIRPIYGQLFIFMGPMEIILIHIYRFSGHRIAKDCGRLIQQVTEETSSKQSN